MLCWMCVFSGEHTFYTICVAFLRNTALDAGKEVLVVTGTLEVDPFAVFGGGAGTALFLDGVSMVHSIMTRNTLGMNRYDIQHNQGASPKQLQHWIFEQQPCSGQRPGREGYRRASW